MCLVFLCISITSPMHMPSVSDSACSFAEVVVLQPSDEAHGGTSRWEIRLNFLLPANESLAVLNSPALSADTLHLQTFKGSTGLLHVDRMLFWAAFHNIFHSNSYLLFRVFHIEDRGCFVLRRRRASAEWQHLDRVMVHSSMRIVHVLHSLSES